MKAKTFDRKFDAGEEIVDQLDLNRARSVGTDPRRVNLDFPVWMVDSLDREARRIGITRQSLIKLWLADRLPNRFRAENARRDLHDQFPAKKSRANQPGFVVWGRRISGPPTDEQPCSDCRMRLRHSISESSQLCPLLANDPKRILRLQFSQLKIVRQDS
jgi:hypothetical protein